MNQSIYKAFALLAVTAPFALLLAAGYFFGVLDPVALPWQGVLAGFLVFCGGGVIAWPFLRTLGYFHQLKAARVTGQESEQAAWLLAVARLYANKVGVPAPCVAIFEGPPLVIVTRDFRGKATFFVSASLFRHLGHPELRAAIAYGVARSAESETHALSMMEGLYALVVQAVPAGLAFLSNSFLGRRTPLRRSVVYQVTAGVLFFVFGGALYPLLCACSRRCVFSADRSAVEILGQNASLQKLIFVLAHHTHSSGSALLVSAPRRFKLFDTHPSYLERIKAIA